MQKIHKKFGLHLISKTKKKQNSFLINFKAFKKKTCTKFSNFYYLQNCIGYYTFSYYHCQLFGFNQTTIYRATLSPNQKKIHTIQYKKALGFEFLKNYENAINQETWNPLFNVCYVPGSILFSDHGRTKQIISLTRLHCIKKFLFWISSVNMTKSTGNCGFSHMY